MKRLTILITALFCACATQQQQTTTTTTTAAASPNPFFQPSPLQFQAPQFNLISDTQYEPAIEEGMRQQIAETDAIANNTAPPTFENTIVAMERSGALLTRVTKVFFNLTQSNTNPAMQKIEEEESPKLSAHQDSIYMNPKLFARVKAIYDQRGSLGLDRESSYLVERYEKNFIRAGAQLSEADKAKLRALNQEEATLTTQFHNRVLGDTKDSSVVVDNVADLAGLPQSDIDAAAQAAKDRGFTGRWVIAMQNTTQQPALTYLQNPALRARILAASEARGQHGGPNDTRAIVTRLAQLRADKAQLLGYPTYAAYVLDDQMAKTPENAFKLMTDMVPASTGRAREEAAQMQKLTSTPLTAADWEFYAEKVRQAQYALDESQVRPYFEFNNVLENGVFYAANQMYGLTFKERKDLPPYQKDVRVFEIDDSDGKPLAIYYADPFQRGGKSGGAWQDSFVDQSGLLGTHPVVVNVWNFTQPAPGQPALLSFGDVTTMFHEFGHALHSMFSNVRYPTVAGTNVPRDFVEFPSQFNEHWALEPRVFAHYAKHYQTGAPMPADLVAKIRKSRTFNQGYALTEYLEAALVDMAWHTLAPGTPLQDVTAFESSALQRFNIAMPLVPPRYHTTYFLHIWSNGYAAGYYAYLWSEVIGHDAYYWFNENGGMTRANGQKFRDAVLSRGGSEDVAQMYRNFRGRDPIVTPLLIERGLQPAPPNQ